MNKLIYVLGALIIYSCSSEINKTNSNTVEIEKDTTITETIENDNFVNEVIEAKTFSKVNGKGLLIGKQIQLLDENFEEIKDISFLNKQFVSITEISDKYYKKNPEDNYCEESKFVKIKTPDLEGYIYGENIYQPIKSDQNRDTVLNNNQISFTATNNFGMGVADEEGLTGCSIYTPTIFKDENAQFEGLITVTDNSQYSDDYQYFELKNDDMAFDEIESISIEKNNYFLKIKRSLQDGTTYLNVTIFKNSEGKYTAKITED